jgi:hypothetical protein
MREKGTYFEQVPKAVIEKILARQIRLLDEELIGAAASSRQGGNNATSKTRKGSKSRSAKR